MPDSILLQESEPHIKLVWRGIKETRVTDFGLNDDFVADRQPD